MNIVFIRIVRYVFVLISLVLLSMLVGGRCWGRMVYLIGLKKVEWMLRNSIVLSIRLRLMVEWLVCVIISLVVFSVMIVIFVVFMMWMICVLLWLFVNCLVSVEKRKNGMIEMLVVSVLKLVFICGLLKIV